MNGEKYIQKLVTDFGNELLKHVKNTSKFEECLNHVINTIDALFSKGKLSEEDVDIIWNKLVKIFEEYEIKYVYNLFEQSNVKIVSLIKIASKYSKSNIKKATKSDLMISRKGFKK